MIIPSLKSLMIDESHVRNLLAHMSVKRPLLSAVLLDTPDFDLENGDWTEHQLEVNFSPRLNDWP